MQKTLCIGFVGLCLFAGSWTVRAQDVRQNIVSEKRSETSPAASAALLFPFCPIDEWTGKRFVFLPRPKDAQDGTYDDFSGNVKYMKYVGRVGKVVSVSNFRDRRHIEFEMEDDGQHLRAATSPGRESIRGLGPLDDIEAARKRWEGKTLWCRMGMLSVYDEQTDRSTTLKIRKYSPVKVAAVVAGWNEDKPIRLHLELADGKRAFLDLNLSGTNVFQEIRSEGRFEHCLLEEDPHLKYRWPAATWKSIENSQIVIGMTAEQLRMSWGEPEKITRTAAGEAWTYPGHVLVLKNGVLSTVK